MASHMVERENRNVTRGEEGGIDWGGKDSLASGRDPKTVQKARHQHVLLNVIQMHESSVGCECVSSVTGGCKRA